jgi:hypothetical protein
LLRKCCRPVVGVVMEGYLAVYNEFFTGFKEPSDVFDKLVLVAFVQRQWLATHSPDHM